MHAELVMIGTELLLGEIVDTNATKLAKMLREIGLDLYYKTTVGDNLARITDVLNLALDRSDVVITSGGLGPTVDDMTRQAVADATGRPLVYSTELEEQIAERFRSFGREMKENNKRQAYIPDGAVPLPNPVGSAPCFLSDDIEGRGFIVSLPGVPRELEYMMQHTVLPLLIERMGGAQVMKVRMLRTCAVGESNVDRIIGDLMTASNPTVGLAAHAGQTDVRIAAKAATQAEAEARIAPVEAELRRRLGVAVYGVDKETVPEVVGRLLVDQDLQLGVVDTLTGGEIARDLTEAGFGERIAKNLQGLRVAEAVEQLGLPADTSLDGAQGMELTAALAKAVAPPEGVGLALIGPLTSGETDNMTFIAVHGPEDVHLAEMGRGYSGTTYVHRWLTIQSLDRVRRVMLKELESAAD
ncbi:MAG: CinA family nicotinamide mononucleotide deamidase-related protein [Anaerolineae bacterium]|nr:CinA family nicotinamide mononucleotide deamidase-related protein [Anaerolineae bacterium]